MQRAFSVSDDLYPFESQWYEHEGIPVHYIDEGSGPTLLFMHGNPTWSFLYRDIIRELRGSFRCIAADYPGMGLSGKPRDYGRSDYRFSPREHSHAIEGLVNHLDLTDVTMMVQDWGGPIGIGIATRQPDRFARLVIGNTWAWPMNSIDGKVFSNVLGRGVGRMLIMRRNMFVEWLLPAGISNKARLTSDVMDAYRGPYAQRVDREPTAVFPRAITTERSYLAGLEANLDLLADKPVLLVWGTKDKAFKKRELDRWRSVFPSARVKILEGANHFIQEDAPDTIAAEIRAFASE
jgi:haloalkane dehalogenase